MALGEREQYLIAIVGADITAFRKGMRDVRSEIGFLNEETTSSLGKLGRTLTYTLTTPLLAAGTVLGKAASDFDASMRNINSIALMTEDQFGSLSQKVIDFGKNTREGVTAASEALYTLYSAGLTGSLAFDVMEVSTKTAEAGLSDLTVTSEALAAAMLSFGFTTEEEAWRASNALTRMVQIGVGSMQSFAGSISTFMPSAAALGVPIEEVFALNARLTQMGYSASEAAVRVNASMRSMIKPSEAMSAAFGQLGVSSTQALIEKYGGLTEALIALRGTTDGSEEALAELFSDTRALQGVLLFTQDIEKTRQVLKDFNMGLDTATMDAWNQQSQSFAYNFDRMKTAIQAVSIVLGQQLLPMVLPLVTGFTDWLLGITELNKEQHQMIVILGAITAVLPPLIWLISSMVSPLGLIVTGIAAVKHAFDTDFMGIATIVQNAVTAAIAAIEPLKTAIQELMDDIFLPGEATPGGDQSVPLAPGLPQTPSAMGTLTIPISVTYEVKEGDSFWQIWSDNFREQYPDFSNFMAATGLDSKIIIHPGDVINIGASTTGIGTTVGGILTGGVDMAYASMTDDYLTTKSSNFWERVSNALSMNAEQLKAGLDQALANIKPVIDTFGGQLFSALAGAFNTEGSTGDGGSWFYDTLVGGIESGAAILNGGFAETFPTLSAGLNQFVSNVGTWLLEEGVPTISRSIGFLVGKLGILMAKGLAGVWDFISGGGASEGANQFGESVGTPFMEGMSDAMASENITDVADQIVIGIAGMIGAAALVKYGLFTVAAEGINAGMSLAFKGFKWAAGYVISNGLLGVIMKAGTAITATTTGIAAFAGAVMTAISGAFAAFTATSAAVVAAVAPLGTAIVGAIGAIVLSPVTLGIVLGIIITSLFFEPINEFWDKSGIRGTVQAWADDLEMRINDLINSDMVVTVNPEVVNQVVIDTTNDDMSSKTNPAIERGVDVEVVVGEVGTGTFWEDMNSFLSTTITDLTNSAETQQAIVMSSDRIVTDLAGNISTFMADGLIEESEVATAISEPIFNALNPVFGEGGTVRTMWQSFVGEFVEGTGAITLSAGLLALSLPAIFTGLNFSLAPIIDSIVNKFNELLTILNTVKTALDGLGSTIIPTTPGTTETDGAETVPPEVDVDADIVVPDTNMDFPQEILDQGAGTQSETVIHNEKININGVKDVDTFIKELARRGIYLERRS